MSPLARDNRVWQSLWPQRLQFEPPAPEPETRGPTRTQDLGNKTQTNAVDIYGTIQNTKYSNMVTQDFTYLDKVWTAYSEFIHINVLPI